MLEPTLKNIVDDDALKWIFVSGKGGCGKTTNSCSLAARLSETRKSVLLVSLDPAHNLSDAFNQKFSREPTRVNGFSNLDVMEVEPPSSDEMNSDGAVPEEIAELTSAIPGIDEAMAFGTLMRSVREMDYEVIVFDTAPTGHSLRLMNFPQLLEKALGMMRGVMGQFGPMMGSMSTTMGLPQVDPAEINAKIAEIEDIAKQISDTFRDKARCTFVCVCIAEFLSVFETERLIQQLTKFGINVRNIVVNQVVRDADLSDKDRAQALYSARIQMQSRYLEQLVELYGEDFHLTPMPLLSGEVRGPDALKKYAKLLLEEKTMYFEKMSTEDDLSEYPGHVQNVVNDENLSWIFVGGKGGVGKTTTSSSLAVALEAKGKKVLLVSTDPAHNLSDAFGQKISGSTSPTKMTAFSSIYALEVDPSDATENFLSSVVSNSPTGETTGNELATAGISLDTIRQLVTSVPGIDEAVSFSQIAKLAKNMDFDAVVVDMAPTGHALRLLGFPAVADKALAKFESLRDGLAPMMQMLTGADPNMQTRLQEATAKLAEARASVETVSKMLTDQEKTTFVCVAIAEFLSVYETERLVQELVTMDINVRNVVCNQLMDPKEADVVAALKTRATMQKKYLDQISELYSSDDFHVTRMPLLPKEVRGLDALRMYGDISMDKNRPL